ncbi:Bro-N domain-containing protein [Pedobacter heparinus]|uniref:BRO-N domain-containing protein n=1 Tax=Pedobacter heparinus TaxID=984 RepID=UPI00292FC9FB|nr:Bro-N domain-containing protein [Pedobacter heparinus]
MDIKLFESKRIRSEWSDTDQKWYFSVIDVIAVLTESNDPKDYWYRMKKREKLSGVELSTLCRQLKLESSDGKKYATDCSDTESLLRIIQSVPSPKAEPFKVWLAKVGYERMQEIENPELAQARMRDIYRAKGYSEGWIDKRVRGIAVRDELTGEWKTRGVKEGIEYSILTAEISKATFGIIPSDHKQIKGLTKPAENLRDHMTDLELIFTMLGEASTTEIAKSKDAQGFEENKKAAKAGGTIAGNARKELEQKSGKKIVSKENYLDLKDKKKLK